MTVIRTELTRTETYQATRQVHDTTVYTVTMSEREAVLVAYLVGRVPIKWGTRLYGELSAALPKGHDDSDWPGTLSFVTEPIGHGAADQIAKLLSGFSDRRE